MELRKDKMRLLARIANDIVQEKDSEHYPSSTNVRKVAVDKKDEDERYFFELSKPAR